MSDPQQQSASPAQPQKPPRKPAWLRRPMAFQGRQNEVSGHIVASGLHTVCSEARCPNRSECFAQGTATFLVMGSVCTRKCAFCSVNKGVPSLLDWSEIDRIVAAAKSMKLRHAVVTSVTRDDVPDGGAAFFAAMVQAFRQELPGVTIELLIPDLQGDQAALEVVIGSRPDVFNHNIETVPSRYATIRPQADYHRSLSLLQKAARSGLVVKSGIMVGLGETVAEVHAVLDDLKNSGCSLVTIGQYLQPTPHQTPVVDYIAPEQFDAYASYGEHAGIRKVVAGPFVRSSYHAFEVLSRM